MQDPREEAEEALVVNCWCCLPSSMLAWWESGYVSDAGTVHVLPQGTKVGREGEEEEEVEDDK
jgi:hypothetical protein